MRALAFYFTEGIASRLVDQVLPSISAATTLVKAKEELQGIFSLTPVRRMVLGTAAPLGVGMYLYGKGASLKK